MKKEVFLKPVDSSLSVLKKLEKRNIIKLLRPSESAVKTGTKTGSVTRFYVSPARLGGHTLMCVGKRTKKARLTWHDGNEDFFLLNPAGIKFNALYLIAALLKRREFLKKFRAKTLCPKDFLAVKLEFNNPRTSFFTMLKDSVHCEITEDKPGQHPVFFVAESSKLKDNKLPDNFYDIKILR
jgi:hypothetical protein